MLTLTSEATQAIEQILENPAVPDGAGVRISVASDGSENGSTPNPIELTMVIVSEPAGDDHVIEDAGARVFVDETLSDVLDDKELDAAVDGEQVQFRLADQV